MKSLVKWQIISLMSRGVAMALGIIQSVVIVRILSVSDYGLVNIAVSVGSAFGIYQHLGLASGSTREISSAEDDGEIFKIFVTSVIIRYFVTIPLAIFLFLFSKYIAITQYGSPEMVLPLKLFSLVLLVQGVQSMFNSVISGMQRFKALFIYQMVIAVASLVIYIPLIYFFKVNGYFYSLVLFNLVGSVSLGFLALKPLKTKLALPTKKDFKRLLKDILSISMGIYVVKIIYTYWQKSGPLLLGLNVTAEDVGLFSFALLYGAKLMTVSDAVTDVNLPVLSKKFIEDVDGFKKLFSANFDKVFAFILLAATSAIFWSKEIFFIFVGSDKYDLALPLVLPMVYAFIFYSVVNIVKSSILIPAKFVREMILGFVLMLAGTVGFYFAGYEVWGALPAMAYGMVFGAFLGMVVLLIVSKQKLGFMFLNARHLLLFVIGLIISYIDIGSFFVVKVIVYLMLVAIYTYLVVKLGFVTKQQLLNLFNSIKMRFVRIFRKNNE